MGEKILDSIGGCIDRRPVATVQVQVIGEGGGNPIPGKSDPARLDLVDMEIQGMEGAPDQDDHQKK